jgi:sporulation protein YpjB
MDVFRKRQPLSAILGFWLLMCMIAGGCGLSAAGGGQPSGKAADPADSASAETGRVEYVNRLSGELYQSVQSNRLDDALDKLEQLGREATQIQYAGITGTEGAEAFLAAINQGKRALVRVHPSEAEIQLSAARIRLAADALAHPEQPMWLDYYQKIQDDIAALRQAAEKKQFDVYVRAFERLERRYSLLRPSMLINREPSAIQQMDSLVAYFRERQNDFTEMDIATFSYVINQLQIVTDRLFWQEDEPAFLPVGPFQRPFHWITVIGIMILSVLAYVGWKKFRYEHGKIIVPANRKGRENSIKSAK